MQPTSQPPPFGPAAIAAYWVEHGWPSSRQLADRYVRIGVRGSKCPAHSLEAALDWRKTHTAQRQPGKNRAITTTTTHLVPSRARSRPLPDAPTDDSLESSLARARAMEGEQYHLWLDAIAHEGPAEQSLAIRAHKDALSARMETEKRIVEHLTAAGQLVSLTAAQDLISQRLAPLRAARAALSHALALELFPENPTRAQPRIEAALVSIFDAPAETAAIPLLAPQSPSPLTTPAPTPPAQSLHVPAPTAPAP